MPQKNSVTFSSKPNHATRAAHAQAREMFSEYDTSQIMPKKSKLPIVFGVLIAVVVILVIVALVMHFFLTSGNESEDLLPQGETATITVVTGDSATAIATQLVQAGLISNSKDFISRVQALSAESSLQAGTYEIEGGTSIDDIIAILQAGTAASGDTLVVYEGETLATIASAVESVTDGRITAEEFTEAATASRWTTEFSFTEYAGAASLEGFLFPAT